MRILITGGAGYIGSELVFKLDKLGGTDKIIIYDNLSRKGYDLFIGKKQLSDKLQFIRGDILDSRKLKQEVEKADIVIHLAAKVTYPFMETSPHEFEQINHWGTSEVAYAVENSNVKKFIHMSSVSVYGAHDQIVKDTNAEMEPMTYYGISKKRAEEHVQRIVPIKDTYIFRTGNVYGYGKKMRLDSVVNRLMFEANYYRKMMIKGTGSQDRTFIHVDTVTDALIKVIKNEITPGIYNLTESNWSILQIADVVRGLYPDTETMYTNQYFPIRSIMVLPDPKCLWLQERDLKKDMKELKEMFTF